MRSIIDMLGGKEDSTEEEEDDVDNNDEEVDKEVDVDDPEERNIFL